MPRPRKQGTVHEFRFTLRLWEGEGYDDLIAYLEAVPRGQLPSAVIQAMLGGLDNSIQPATDDIDDDLLDIADDLLM